MGKPRNVIQCMQHEVQRKQIVWVIACIFFSCVQMLKVKNNVQELEVLVLGYCSYMVPVTL
jgi:hypothetical protein